MIIVDEGKGWLSRYPPGHSLWLAPGMWLGDPYLMIALAAGLGVWLTGWAAARIGASVAGVVLLLLVSPFYVFTHGTLLSHVSGFLASAIMMLAYVLWRQLDRPWWAVIAGLAWGWLFLNRTYTAFLMAIPFALDALWCLWRQRDRRALEGTLLFAGAAVSGVIALLAYNYLVLGNPLKMTYLFYDPTDNLGFGLRHHGPVYPAPEPVMHTPGKGLRDLIDNLQLFDRWLLGFSGGGIVWLILTAIGWHRRWSALMVGAFASTAVGYVLFWYPGWNQTGPNYYFETLPMLALTMALGVSRLARMARRFPVAGLMTGLVLLAGWGWALSFFYRSHMASLRSETRERSRVIAVMASPVEPTLLLIRQRVVEKAWPNHDMVFTPDGVEGRVIVARWNESWNQALVRSFPSHRPAVLTRHENDYYVEYLDALPAFDVEFRMGDQHRTTGSNTTYSEDPARVIRRAGADDPPGWLVFRRECQLFPGSFVLEAVVRSSAQGAGFVELYTTATHERIMRVAVPVSDAWETIRVEFNRDDFTGAEPRVDFAGGGEVEVARISIREVVNPAAESTD